MDSLNEESQQHTLFYKEELEKVDTFYNSVIELIEEQRVADRKHIITTRDKVLFSRLRTKITSKNTRMNSTNR